MLVTGERWHHCDRAFENFEQGMLDAQAHVFEPGAGGRNLIDLVYVDDAALGDVKVAVGSLDQSGEQGLNVFGEIAASVRLVASPVATGTLRWEVRDLTR